MKYIILLAIAIVNASSPAVAQKKNKKQVALDSAIAQKTFTFHAQSVLPASGRSRQLTSSYSFTVNKDSVISDLPYFGRAYTAPMDLTTSVLQFNSQKFDYSISSGKKGGWNVNIKFNDVREVQTVFLSISSNGYGTLQAVLTNRQPIGFNGYADQTP